MSKSNSGLQTFRVLLFLCATIGLIVGGWFLNFAYSTFPTGHPEPFTLEVKRGLTPGEITKILEKEHLVSNGRLFHWVGRVTRSWGKLKAGEYEISSKQTPMEIFATLRSGISVARAVTIKEGDNRYEIADEIVKKGLATRESFLAATADPLLMRELSLTDPLPPTLEGFLFPETYYFNRAMSASDMVRVMVKRTIALWTPERQELAKSMGLDLNQTMILASIIEKETGNAPDRPIISAVFHNRLRKGMRLQTDPTVIYGIWDRFQGKIHKSDLLTPGPYNTYTIPGLPPGAIGNAGLASIDAALHPAASDALYFVSRNDGTTQFSANYEAHAEAVKKHQLDPKAREGKSWRDLVKKRAAESATTTTTGKTGTSKQ